ncbi:MAG: hypothetical protein IJB99_09545 [Clostridia bacterium]|nr:hypothetical protein [Clostridia bacterium]
MKKINGSRILEWLYRLKEALLHKIFLKILSVVFAMLIWAYIIDTTPDLTRSRFVENLSVSVTGTTTLNNNGLALATDIYSEFQGAIDANVDVSQKEYANLSNENVSVFLDVSNVRSSGMHEIPLTATSTHGTVTNLYPESISVMFEYIDSRELPIDIEMTGTTKDNYWYSVNEASMNPQTVTVSGPASIVQGASRAVAQVDVTGQAAPFRRAAILRLQDSDGESLNTRLLTRSSSTCSVSIEVYPTKELPVTADASQIIVADGFEIEEITFQPASITVAAQSALLDEIDELPVEIPDNMPVLNKTYTKRLSLSKLPEFKFMSTNQVYMTITLKEKVSSAAVSNVPVQVLGLGDEYEAMLMPGTVSVMVTGAYSKVNEFTREDVYVYADMSNLVKGTYHLPVFIGNNSELSYDLITPQFIKVVITDSKRNVVTPMEE